MLKKFLQFGEKYYRDAGSGPYRMHKPIGVREDLYSMLFVMCFRPEYIQHYKQEKEMADEAMKAMINEYKKKKENE